MNLSTFKYFSKSTSLLFFLPILLFSCSKEPKDPLVKVSGVVENRYNNLPIGGILLNMDRPGGLFTSTPVESVSSNNSGEFSFYECDGFIYPSTSIFESGYQKVFWANDKVYNNCIFTCGFSLPSACEPIIEVKFELFPRASFELHLTNIEPSSESDSIIISIDNADLEDLVYTGILDGFLMRSETLVENGLTINYDVVQNGETKSFSKFVECVPGTENRIHIEY